MRIPKGLKHQKIFFELGEKLVTKVAQKNSDYGSAFEQIEKILTVLYPNGIPKHQYGNASLFVRMLDKMCRLANESSKFFNEDAWDDFMGYSFLGKIAQAKKKALSEEKK